MHLSSSTACTCRHLRPMRRIRTRGGVLCNICAPHLLVVARAGGVRRVGRRELRVRRQRRRGHVGVARISRRRVQVVLRMRVRRAALRPRGVGVACRRVAGPRPAGRRGAIVMHVDRRSLSIRGGAHQLYLPPSKLVKTVQPVTKAAQWACKISAHETISSGFSPHIHLLDLP